ncbi:SprT-like domain-containing protein [Pectinatus frisingensis]|uniref:SprT-like domain-containing protein n=1 Tax=Pectinatus frisingensis TaxID=865 RepID=UPI0018C63982|nr:SprT-like domain-containing protein [Pectinatus frisingensis]
MEQQTITTAQYGALQDAFTYYNKALFAGSLPEVILTFSRKSKALGFFVPSQWSDSKDSSKQAHEISMNPDYMSKRSSEQFFSTLVHEMCHLWQETSGKPPRRCYHNKEFADKMELVGLICSNTGVEGGKRTGQSMTHYVAKDGRFIKAFNKMPEGLYLPFTCKGLLGSEKKKVKKASHKVKYTCPICGAFVTGAAGLNIKCAECNEFMI